MPDATTVVFYEAEETSVRWVEESTQVAQTGDATAVVIELDGISIPGPPGAGEDDGVTQQYVDDADAATLTAANEHADDGDEQNTTAIGIVADGLTTEAVTARAAEQANATAISTEATTRGTAVTNAIATAAADATAKVAVEHDRAIGVEALKADLVGGTVPAAQLPSYLDDVLEFANLAAFPVTGESGKAYFAIDTNKSYRWTGSAYAGLDEGIALGETSSTAYRGDRGKTAYDHSQVVTGNPHGTTVTDLGAVPTTRTISTTSPLTGGGDLSANRTLAISAATAGAAGSMSAADKAKLDAITGTNTGTNTGDQDLSGLVPKTTQVNGHALSSNVTVTASDVGLGNVNNTADASKTFTESQITGLVADLAARVLLTWQPTPVRKATNQTYQSQTALQTDSALTFAIAANEVWKVKWIVWATGSATADLTVGVNGPSGCVPTLFVLGPSNAYTGSAATNMQLQAPITALATATGVYGTQPSVPVPVVIEGTITNGSTAGTVALQHAQSVSTAVDTVILAASTLERSRIA